jgi:hypothetical protein
MSGVVVINNNNNSRKNMGGMGLVAILPRLRIAET